MSDAADWNAQEGVSRRFRQHGCLADESRVEVLVLGEPGQVRGEHSAQPRVAVDELLHAADHLAAERRDHLADKVVTGVKVDEHRAVRDAGRLGDVGGAGGREPRGGEELAGHRDEALPRGLLLRVARGWPVG